MIKCDVVVTFMSLHTSDMQVNDEKRKYVKALGLQSYFFKLIINLSSHRKKSRIPKRNQSLSEYHGCMLLIYFQCC